MKKKHLRSAAKVAGVNYTRSEIAQMARAGIEPMIERARASRALRLANEVPMASRFDPRLGGFEMPAQAGVMLDHAPRPLPGDDADIAHAALPDLAHWIREGALSSERLTRIYLDRIAAHGDGLKCFAQVLGEAALAEARAADAAL